MLNIDLHTNRNKFYIKENGTMENTFCHHNF